MDPLTKTGEQAPQFQLPDLKGNLHSLDRLRGWITVLNFWSAECTWCERVDLELIRFLDAWKEHTRVLWIASNANESRHLIERVATERNLPAVLLDPLQTVADLYGAQTTPHFFVVDTNGLLAYQGAWDDVTFRKRVASVVYVPQVVEALSHNLAVELANTPPYGCTLVRFAE